MKNRRCLKCGASSADPDVTLYRFPKPGLNNILRCELWAKYMFPNDSWNSTEFQNKLFSKNFMLCHKHFKNTSFMDVSQRKLYRDAAPEIECYQATVSQLELPNLPDPSLAVLDITNTMSKSDVSSGLVQKMVRLNEEPFGTFKNEKVRKFIWTTDSGFSVSVISYGAIIQSIKVPGKTDGSARYNSDVVLGFDDLDGYVNRNEPYFGANIGRCANRIGGASFDIDGVTYTLQKNNGQHHLHGGLVGFDKVNWNSFRDENKVIFSYLSKDGEEGYPGDLITNVIYEVKDDDTLYVEFVATTTKKTVVNLTNHSYFNLAGHDSGSDELFNHVITINADKITKSTAESIPTGSFINVGGTHFDLRVPTTLGDAMSKAGEIDHNYCVNPFGKHDLNFVSRVSHPASGRYLEVYSNQPGVQLYTSNFLPAPAEPALVGKSGAGYRVHGAFCLETQNYPDAVHHPEFPKVILKPGEIYRHRVNYRFGV